jgi:hypothetical protein
MNQGARDRADTRTQCAFGHASGGGTGQSGLERTGATRQSRPSPGGSGATRPPAAFNAKIWLGTTVRGVSVPLAIER